MAFRVGQRVVCVESKGHEPIYRGAIEPDLNDIGTITNVYVAQCGYLALELAEFPAPGGQDNGRTFEPGWLAHSFRPVVERKTDISIFTAMLDRSPAHLDAERTCAP